MPLGVGSHQAFWAGKVGAGRGRVWGVMFTGLKLFLYK